MSVSLIHPICPVADLKLISALTVALFPIGIPVVIVIGIWNTCPLPFINK